MKWIIPAVLLPALLAASCVTRQADMRPDLARGSETPRVAPTLALERFLRAANARDLQTMSELFGTEDGSINRQKQADDVERQMFALANMLRHEDFQILGESVAPGRLGRAVGLLVRIDQGRRTVDVPFVLVHTRDDRWLVEQFDPDPLVSR